MAVLWPHLARSRSKAQTEKIRREWLVFRTGAVYAAAMKLALFCLLLSSTSAFAQAQIVPKEETLKPAEDDAPQGWNPTLAGTATVNVVSNSNVVGQVDGLSTLFGVGVAGGADYTRGRHVLRNTLAIAESFARTPVVDEFVKTSDVVQLEGLYNYFFNKNLGGFGRLALQSALFSATDVRGTETSWVEKRSDGTTTPLATNAFRQQLAGSFAPFTINESAGLFANPTNNEKLSLSVRLGLGGRHTFASGVLLIDDDSATANLIELLRLSDVHQLGAEAFAGATGKLQDGKVTYKAGLSVLAPFVNNDKFDRGISKLTRVGFEGNLTFNVFDWMSLVYSVLVVRDAQLFPEGNELTQVQNNLLLTFKYAFVKKKETPKVTPEQELAEAKARAAAAEANATELRRQLDACTTKCPDTGPTEASAGTPAPAEAPAPAPATP